MRVLHILALIGLLLFPSFAMAQSGSQDTPMFRLGVNWSDSTDATNPPETDTNDDDVLPPEYDEDDGDPEWWVTYPDTVASGASITVSPEFHGSMPDGASGGPEYESIANDNLVDMPTGLSLNSTTGVISGVPVDSGTIRVPIRVSIPMVSSEGTSYQSRPTNADITVAGSAYVLNVSPSNHVVIQMGKVDTPSQVVISASPSPAQPSAGEEWGVQNADLYFFEDLTEPDNDGTWVLPSPSLTVALDDPDMEIDRYGADRSFQFYRKDNLGNKTASAPVRIQVLRAPGWYLPDPVQNGTWNGTWDDDLGLPVIEIKPNLAFKIQPTPHHGTAGAPASWPAGIIPAQGTIPPGVTISSTGAVKGTTTAAVGSTFNFIIPAKSNDNAFGYEPVVVRVVSEFGVMPDDDDGDLDPWCAANPNWWINDSENNHGCATEEEYNDKWCEIHSGDWADYDPDNMHGCAPCFDESDNEIACEGPPDPVDLGPYGDGDLGPYDWNLYPVCPLSSPYAGVVYALGDNTGSDGSEYMKWFKGVCHCQEWSNATTTSYRNRTAAELERIRRGDPSSSHAICRTSQYHLDTGYFDGFPEYDGNNNIVP